MACLLHVALFTRGPACRGCTAVASPSHVAPFAQLFVRGQGVTTHLEVAV
jgi:hypothetical protein